MARGKAWSPALQKAKVAVAHELEGLDRSHQERISKAIARMCVAAIHDDRKRRSTSSQLVKLFDVFFNGRPAE